MPQLTAITDSAAIAKAMRIFKTTILKGTTPRHQNVGSQGGSYEYNIHWDPKRGMWSLFDSNPEGNRNWNCFGMDEPDPSASMSIDCEINFPHEGIDRRVAGVFARDERGIIYATHSGKIGGGRPGIGKEAFSSAYRGRGQWCDIDWPAIGETTSAIVLGAVDDPTVSDSVAHFVREVRRFKATATRKDHKEPIDDSIKYVPEFVGEKSPYSLRNTIRSRARHGIVVSRLFEEVAAARLASQGWRVGNNRWLDLYIARGGQIAALFEVKTELSTTNLYTAIGQLMLHGAGKTPPIRILVLPRKPKSESVSRLEWLGVKVLCYHWVGSDVRLENLEPLLPR